jgi:uncharacterized protein (DUF427 family)
MPSLDATSVGSAAVRPPQRIEPGPGQESVWDYPRPPAVSPTEEHVRVVHHGVVIADTHRPIRILETSQPPAYYLPAGDVDTTRLRPSTTRTFCEWKGVATYWSIDVDGQVLTDAAWSYAAPSAPFVAIRGHFAFYAQFAEECWVDDERVIPNAGSFYGGWVTSRVVGPFKGAPGTMHW